MSSVRYDNAPGESSEAILNSSKQLAELLQKIQENIARASNKNESLLEAIESSEAKASLSGSNEVARTISVLLLTLSIKFQVPLLRNIRARLAAAHTPNSALRRDLAFFSGELIMYTIQRDIWNQLCPMDYTHAYNIHTTMHTLSR